MDVKQSQLIADIEYYAARLREARTTIRRLQADIPRWEKYLAQLGEELEKHQENNNPNYMNYDYELDRPIA